MQYSGEKFFQTYQDFNNAVVFFTEKDLHQRKNQAVLFTGAIDGQGYLLDVNDSGSYKPKGTHYMIVCTEDLLRVSCDTHTTISVASSKYLVECIHSVWPDIQLTKKSCRGQLVNEQFSGA